MKPSRRSGAKKLSTQVIATLAAAVLLASLAGPACGSTELAKQSPAEPAANATRHPVGAAPAPAADSSTAAAKLAAPAAAQDSKQEATSSDQDAASRRGRSEAPPAPASAANNKADSAPSDSTKVTEKLVEKADSAPAAKTTSKPAASGKQPAGKPSGAGQLSAKSGASSSKKALQSHLGTVTSTGSGGPTHYMSQHDTYSAIAEKHGALAQGASRKSDKRRLQHSFGGIQKASGGVGDLLNPFKGVTESELARTLGASVRSIIKGKYSVPAYVASALLGAVALMAFYESPISPLPVPPLPEPPVGRFPPEMPSLPPGTQVPFRGNFNQQQQQQGGYDAYGNQRSLQLSGFGGPAQPQQQQQQVLFPGANGNVAQQRSSEGLPVGGGGGPVGGSVQQLAANLLSSVGAKQLAAQRKSGPDYEPASSRSFFGGAANVAKLGHPANQQKPQNSILSFFGFGGESGNGAASAASASASSSAGHHSLFGADIQQASNNLNGLLAAIEPKGQSASGLSNSHVVNKVKSYFNARPAHGHSHSTSAAAGAGAPANPYEEYARMSFVQALMKDTAFLPAFLNPTRKSSSSSPGPGSSSSSSSSSSSQNSFSSSPSGAAAAPSAQPAAARMQVDRQPILPNLIGGLTATNQPQAGGQQQQLAAPANTKRASSGFGLVRAADRIAHALLDTFTSGLLQGRSTGSQQQLHQQAEQKKAAAEQQSPLISATSLLTDIMSSYSAQQATSNAQPEYQTGGNAGPQLAEQQQQQLQHNQAAPASGSQQQRSAAAPGQQQASSQSDAALGRSADSQPVAGSSISGDQQQSAAPKQPEAQAAPTSSTAQQQTLVRKTRSVGFEYPNESNQALARYEQQQSRAAQINNLVDFVADSYAQNRLLFNFVMNQVGLSQAVPYVEQILASSKESSNMV